MSNIDEMEIRSRLEQLSKIQPTPESTERAINRARIGLSWGKVTTAYKIKSPSPIFKFAAAAVLLICLGFLSGWLFAPKTINAEQLRAEIEASLKSSLAVNCEQIKDELSQQVQRDLTEFAAQTLAASTTMTDQRLMKLIRLIDAARMQDYLRVAAALEKIEIDKTKLGESLITLASRTDELLRTEQNTIPSAIRHLDDKTGG
jgi:predicted Mrr-cat superfamily restriction endonuclease